MRSTVPALLVFLSTCPLIALAHAPAPAAGDTFAPYTEHVPRYLVKIEMVPVTGGRFVLSPVEKGGQPAEVEVKDFWMAKCELTWDSVDAFLFRRDLADKNDEHAATYKARTLVARPTDPPYSNPDRGYGHAGHPTISLHFRTANAYCEWLSITTGRKYRLPTEAEFEYAARAGREGQPTPEALSKTAWHRENARRIEEGDLAPSQPGKLAANPWGLHDLLGNVAEWTLPAKPGVIPAARGGSFRTPARLLRYDYRQPFNPDTWQRIDPGEPKNRWYLSDADFVGFRVVRERDVK
jgi:formylglycine-generating enzyme required for sulfatase activity